MVCGIYSLREVGVFPCLYTFDATTPDEFTMLEYKARTLDPRAVARIYVPLTTNTVNLQGWPSVSPAGASFDGSYSSDLGLSRLTGYGSRTSVWIAGASF
jgi:hypothetical protein